jgi:phospholipid transport system substrate-binding protein
MALTNSVGGTVKSAGTAAVIILAAILFFSPPARAADPEAYVRSIADKLEPLLNNGHLTAENVDTFLKANILNQLDMQRIGRYVLRKHWKEIDQAGQEKFMDIFQYFILESFKKQLVKYSKAEIKIIRSVEHEPAGVSVITRVRLPSKSPVNMNWRLFRDEGQIRIFDVSVQGISKLSATRAEYKSVLEKQGFDHLITEICNRLEGTKPASC